MTRFEDIKAFAFDVDGVFTDGLVLAMPDGDLLRQFNSKDCFGVRTAVDNGFPCAFITGGVSPSLLHRAHSLGIGDENLYMISKNKAEDLLHFCKRNGLEPWQVAFVGDAIPDILSARDCGADFALVGWTKMPKNELEALEPDYIVDIPVRLPCIIKGTEL